MMGFGEYIYWLEIAAGVNPYRTRQKPELARIPSKQYDG